MADFMIRSNEFVAEHRPLDASEPPVPYTGRNCIISTHDETTGDRFIMLTADGTKTILGLVKEKLAELTSLSTSSEPDPEDPEYDSWQVMFKGFKAVLPAGSKIRFRFEMQAEVYKKQA